MKICHVVYECVPESHRGGVQKMVLELALAQAKRGDLVEIWTIGLKAIRQEISPGACIRYFPGLAGWSSRALRTTLMREWRQFDVLHAHNTLLPLNLWAAATARLGATLFYHAHGALDPKLLTGWNFKAFKKRLYVALFEVRNYNVARAVLGLTDIECHQLALTGTRTAIYEVSNGIHICPPAAPVAAVGFRLRNRITPTQPVILFVGRITHKKGIHYLLDALVLIRRQVPEAVLVLCGGREQDQEYVQTLDAQISRLQLESHVRWAGFVNEEGKRAAFAACTVFAHPSYSEGMAMAVLEAMSFGVPTVVTPGCYMDQAVAADALCLAEQSAESLSENIVGLLQDRSAAKKLAAGGRAYVERRHSWAVIAERLGHIYAGEAEPIPYRSRLKS